jgi:hypothetical protein
MAERNNASLPRKPRKLGLACIYKVKKCAKSSECRVEKEIKVGKGVEG